MIPGVQDLLVSEKGALNFAFGACAKLGEASLPIGLVNVGALFVVDGNPRVSMVGVRPLLAIIIGRLIIMPVVGIGFFYLMRQHVPFFPSDPAVMLVICLESCTPSAYNLCSICLLQGTGAKEIAAGLFFQNWAAVFTVTAWATFIVSYIL